jgi:hypothetical protein
MEVDVSYDVEAQTRVARETGRQLEEAPFVFESLGGRATPIGTAEDLARCIQSGLLSAPSVSPVPLSGPPELRTTSPPGEFLAAAADAAPAGSVSSEPATAPAPAPDEVPAPPAGVAAAASSGEAFDVVHVNWFGRSNSRQLRVAGGQLVRTKRENPAHQTARPLADIAALRRKGPSGIEVAFRDNSSDTYTFPSTAPLDAFLNALLLAGCSVQVTLSH